MKTFKVTYSGNATRYQNFENIVNAESEREAVEETYKQCMDENYFPQEDGSILDCGGDVIAESDDNTIDYDGGCFSAEEMKPIIIKTIEIAGYAKESKTALWTGTTIEEVTNFDLEDYAWLDSEIDEELLKAQNYVDNQVKENGWFIDPKAFINSYEIE